MDFILVRHGEKKLGENTNDPSLTPYGEKQALALGEWIANKCKGREIKLMCSPKKRCQETAANVAKKLNTKVIVSKDLDERHRGETVAQLETKMLGVITSAEKENFSGVWVFISHMDWLECAVEYYFTGGPVFNWTPAAAFMIHKKVDKLSLGESFSGVGVK